MPQFLFCLSFALLWLCLGSFFVIVFFNFFLLFQTADCKDCGCGYTRVKISAANLVETCYM